jgi:hypothetical protein
MGEIFEEERDLLEKELEKYKAAYLALKDGIDFYGNIENWNMTFGRDKQCIGPLAIIDDSSDLDYQWEIGGKRARAASKRASLLLGEGE